MSAILGPLVALALVAASLLAIRPALRPVPVVDSPAVVAYREGRQCYGAVYGLWGGAPERCAYPVDHYGECAP